MGTPQTRLGALAEKATVLGIVEEQGFDAPFGTFTWEQWQEMQARMMQRFTRFQRAIHSKQAKVAILIAQEIIATGMDLLDEANGWIGISEEQ
ncbi:MAG: hypothetical protein ACRDIV_22300 [Ktedonobacteraceae bacterium]